MLLANVAPLLARALLVVGLSFGSAGLWAAKAADAEGDARGCPGPVAQGPATVTRAALSREEVAVTFVGHATFLIESPEGVRIATDYNDHVRPQATPEIVTMNKAHGTHYTLRPDPGIAHVLRGWGSQGQPAHHDVQVRDVRVRNVPTNIRDWADGTEYDGNSIFVFEIAGLCIAHLGHLHHTLEPSQLRKLGRIDVLLVPVDGSYTLDLAGMMEVLRDIDARLMIPMHFFGPATLARFLDKARERYEVAYAPSASLVVSRDNLPATPKVLVLPGF